MINKSKIHQYIILSACLLVAVSCNETGQEQAYRMVNHNREFFLSQELLRPDMFVVKDSVLITYDHNKGADNYFHAFNTINGELYAAFGNFGSGPDDFNFPVQIELNKRKNEISIYDINFSKFRFYNLNNLIENRTDHICEINLTPDVNRAVQENDSIFYCIGTFDSGMFGKCVHEEIRQTYLSFPDVENHNFTPIQKFLLFQGEIKMNEDKTKIVYASDRCDLIKIISIENEDLKEVMTQYTYLPKFRKYTEDSFGILPDNPNGYVCVATTNQYIFALFSGRSEKSYNNRYYFGDIIHVFDWDGNLIEKVLLDKDAWQIYADEESGQLYSIHYEMGDVDYQVHYFIYSIEEIIENRNL